jgi:membrane-associated protein
MEIIHFITDLLKDPLATIGAFIQAHGTLTYGLLCLIIFAETGLVVMPLLPGDSLLFAVGVLAASTGQLDVTVVIPLLIASALLGDNLNYFVGKNFSGYIKSKEKILFLKRAHIIQTEQFYEKHGGLAVILARFVPIVRTVAPFVAGAGSMKYPRYLLFCVLGAVLWVGSITLLGYFLGNNEWIKANFEKVVLGIVAVSVLPILFSLAKTFFAPKKV